MVEPFKNFFNPGNIGEMGVHLARVAPDFNPKQFAKFCIEDIEKLELKQRSNRIVDGLEKFLPKEFPDAVNILVASLDSNTHLPLDSNIVRETSAGIRGWPVMPMADYVARHGQVYPKLALNALKEMTMRWSAEFAIRPFLKNHPNLTLGTMEGWICDPNEHVRRLVSEGTRSRLPWGMRLHQFIADPMPVVHLLSKMRDDQSEYVRRSVANNLNDISKDHPDLIGELAVEWMKGASKDRRRLVRHGLRGLIKQGHEGALSALGYGPALIKLVNFVVVTNRVVLGGKLEFDLQIRSLSQHTQPLIIDFVIHHRLANGKSSPKVFKGRTLQLDAGQELIFSKKHPMKPITTRRYYAGAHRVEIMINGEAICSGEFELVI